MIGVRYHNTMARRDDGWVITKRQADPDWHTGPYPQTDTLTILVESIEVTAGLFGRYAEAIRGLPSGELAIRDLRCERFRLQAEGLVDIY